MELKGNNVDYGMVDNIVTAILQTDENKQCLSTMINMIVAKRHKDGDLDKLRYDEIYDLISKDFNNFIDQTHIFDKMSMVKNSLSPVILSRLLPDILKPYMKKPKLINPTNFVRFKEKKGQINYEK